MFFVWSVGCERANGKLNIKTKLNFPLEMRHPPAPNRQTRLRHGHRSKRCGGCEAGPHQGLRAKRAPLEPWLEQYTRAAQSAPTPTVKCEAVKRTMCLSPLSPLPLALCTLGPLPGMPVMCAGYVRDCVGPPAQLGPASGFWQRSTGQGGRRLAAGTWHLAPSHHGTER